MKPDAPDALDEIDEMDEMDELNIIEGLKPVCQCNGVKKKTVLRLIASGIHSIKALQSASGAGTGSCKGKKCSPRIEALLASIAERH